MHGSICQAGSIDRRFSCQCDSSASVVPPVTDDLPQSDPQSAYARLLDSGQLQPDRGQLEVVYKLQSLHQELLNKPQSAPQKKRGFFSSLFRGASVAADKTPVKGLYLWGGVGRGKTLLCDMFYANLPIKKKKRVHFHRFMQSVHDQLSKINHKESPLEIVAERIASECTVLVLDEMHVNDITDAMLMGGLLQGLFKRGVTLLTTSNIEPDGLYKDGLQRARFLPAIESIKQHVEVLYLGGDIDYRMRLLQNSDVYRSPIDDKSDSMLAAQFRALVATGEILERSGLEINGREIPTVLLADGVAWFEFSALCKTTRSTDDYIEIARSHHTILLSDVVVLDDTDNDAARRFINLVDEFYDRGVKLVITAAVAPHALYGGSRLTFEFERTVSRLMEMQSPEYLASPHLA